MTRLSNRQFPLLDIFSGGKYMSEEDAHLYDQRPFRSMLIRKWITYHPGYGFVITDDGREAFREFMETDIGRKNPERPLTRYFDAAAYGLVKIKKPVEVIRRRRRAA